MSRTEPAPSAAARRGPGREGVRTLNPGYFALVMATGIVSVGMRTPHVYWLSVLLLWLTGIEYAVLVLLNVWRLTAFRSAAAADLFNPSRAFGYFTFVAATDVFGTRLAIDGHRAAGLVLLVVGWLAWVALGYVVPWTAVLGHAHRPVLQYANGTWFVWVVASQSVAVLSAVLEPSVRTGQRQLALLAVFSWSVGVFLYAAAGIFVAARLLMYPLGPDDLTPPYWVATGATAITVLAGARILLMTEAPALSASRGLIAGASLVFWAFGTWLIPPLIAAGVWRHVVHRVPLRYDPSLWSIVFPLGMYGVGSRFLGRADHVSVITSVGDYERWVALAAWTVTFVAMLYHLAHLSHLAPRGSTS